MKRLSIYEKNFKSKKEVSSSAFFFLFSEIVQYCIKKDRQDLEKQLEEMGYPLGARFLELIVFRDKGSKKETNIVSILLFIKHSIWPIVFNKIDCSVEQNENQTNIYMIKEENSLCNQFACLPRGQRHANCSAFTAGLIEGILNAAGFSARVTALFDSEEGNPESIERTTYLINFAPEVLERNLEYDKKN